MILRLRRRNRSAAYLGTVLLWILAGAVPSAGLGLPAPATVAVAAKYPEGLGPIRVLYAQITEPGFPLSTLDFRNIPRSQWGRWDLFLYDYPSGRTTRLTDAALANLYPFGNYFSPAALSPDGRRVAFGGAEEADILFAPSWALMPFTHIWALDVATRKMLGLSKLPSPAVRRKFGESIQVPGQFRNIVWSPDGRQVAADQDVGNPDLMHAGDGGAWCVWEAASGKWLYPPDKAFSEAAKRWRGEHGLRSRSWQGKWAASWDYSSTLHVKNTHTGRSWSATGPKRSQLFWTPDSRSLIMAGLTAYAGFRLSDGHPIRSGKIKVGEFDPLRLSRNGRWLFAVSGLPNAPKLTLWDWQTGLSQEWMAPAAPRQDWEGPVNAWLHTTVPELRVLDVLEMQTPTG